MATTETTQFAKLISKGEPMKIKVNYYESDYKVKVNTKSNKEEK